MALLLAPAFAPALGVMARNPVGIPHAERLLAVSAVIWVCACLLTWALIRFGIGKTAATAISFSVVVALNWGGLLIRGYGHIIGVLLLLLILILVSILAIRSNVGAVKAVTVALAVMIGAAPAIDLFAFMQSFGTDAVTDDTELVATMTDRPDVFLVVFDGHPGANAIEMDMGADFVEAFRSELETGHLTLESDNLASYWITDFSLPSIVNMGLPSTDLQENDATNRSLYRMISGENRLVHLLESNDYQTYMVESGWSGSSCGSEFDVCVPSSWLDEPMYFMLWRSVFWDLIFDNAGYAFTVGAKTTMDWLRGNAQEIANDEQPSFVFAHVMAPHPPFFLNEECQTVVDDSRYGVTFNSAGVEEAERETYLEGQMACLRSFMVELSGLVGSDQIVILVSDHGTDRRNQLVIDSSQWDEAALLERMNVLVAVSGRACALSDPTTLPNVIRHALSCYVDGGLDDVPARVFIGPDSELSDSEISQLGGNGATS